MGVDKIRVKADMGFEKYRCFALGLDRKDFRALQQGKEAEIPVSVYEKHKKVFREVKDGSKRSKILK